MKKLIWLVMGVLILSGSSCEKKLPVADFPAIPYQKDHFPAIFTDSLGKKTIAYEYGGEPKPDDPYYKAGIYLCDFDEREPRLFLHCPGYGISFSPDGNWIVFSDKWIWKIKVNGDSLTLLVDWDDYETEVFRPAWSPDGKKIAFDIAAGPHRGIYLMDPDGSNKERLIELARDPAWSPDGNRLYYSKRTPENDSAAWYDEIYWYDFTTGQEKRLTYLRHSWSTSEPCVAPSGEKITFASQKEQGQLPQIWIMGKDGENPHQITSQGGCDPVFCSEDEILYAKVVWGDGRLWLIGIDGQNDRRFFKE
jgi:Tol biopolymer transport system component